MTRRTDRLWVVETRSGTDGWAPTTWSGWTRAQGRLARDRAARKFRSHLYRVRPYVPERPQRRATLGLSTTAITKKLAAEKRARNRR